MNRAGVIVLILTGALVGLLLAAWVAGLVLGFGGGLIHLLLLLALVLAPPGVVAGIVLLVVGRRQQGRPR